MAAENKADEIPGFHRHPETGRYYRELPGCLIPIETKPSTDEVIPNPKSNISNGRPVLTSFPDCLTNRQNGLFVNQAFEKQITKLRMEKLRKIPSYPRYPYHPQPLHARFLRGGKYSIYIDWELFTGETMFEEILYSDSDDIESFSRRELGKAITDMCEGFEDCSYLLFVFNDALTNLGSIKMYCRDNLRTGTGQLKMTRYNCPIWSCGSNNFTKRFVLGLDNFIIGIDAGCTRMFKNKTRGRNNSVTFNQMGTVVYSGNHRGNLHMTDVRDGSSSDTPFLELDKYGIDETVLLSQENYLLCSGISGMFCTVDLRMNAVANEFFGHVSTPKKRPFSVSEIHDVVCMTGSDNTTRLWSLQGGGHPIKVFKPSVEDCISQSWLVNKRKCTLYICENISIVLYKYR